MSDVPDIRKDREARTSPLPKGLDLGYENWNLNRVLMLCGPTTVVLLFSSLVIKLTPWVAIIVGAVCFLVALAPAYKGELAHERIGLGLRSVHIKALTGGEALPVVEDDEDVSHDVLRSTGYRHVPIRGTIRTDATHVPDNRLVGFLGSTTDARSAYMFRLKPRRNVQLLDSEDRARAVVDQAIAFRRLHLHGVTRTLAAQVQVPVDDDPILDHHRKGRLYTSPKADLVSYDPNDADPIQSLILAHGLATHKMIREDQPESRLYLTVRLLDELAWGARKVPQVLTAQQWAETPLQLAIKIVEDAFNPAGFDAEWLSVLEMLCAVQVSLDPYNADQIYADFRQDLEDTQNGRSVDQTKTYKRGLWPRPVIVTPTGIQTGSTFHTFVMISGYNGATSAELSNFDDLNLWGEPQAIISHFQGVTSGSVWAKEQALKVQLDLTEQFDERMGTRRPRRERHLDDIEEQYRMVTAVNASIRSARFMRLSAGNEAYSQYMAVEALRRFSDCGATGFQVKGIARILRQLERSVVGPIR